MVAVVLIVAVLVVFDLAALRRGADTRPSIREMNDDPIRSI